MVPSLHRSILVSLFTLVFGCVPAALAQSSAPAPSGELEPVVLSAFEVISPKDAGYRVQNSVATTGIAMDLAKTPLPITVITEEFLKDANLEGFTGALRYVSSVSLDPHAENGNYTPGIGGTNSQPNMNRFRGQPYSGTYRNGLRMTYGFFTENVDRVEVAKGPMAVFIGGATLGGELNVITKRPKFFRAGEASLKLSSHRSVTAAIDSTGPLAKQLAYRFIGSFTDRHTWREHSRAQVRFIEPQLLYKPFEKLSTRLDYTFRDSRGNLVSQSVPSSGEYPLDFNQPRAGLLELGRRRTTGPAAGQPFTVAEYRARIGQAFSAWSRDVFDAFGYWGTLGHGDGLIEGDAPSGRKFNYYGPHGTFHENVQLVESETLLAVAPWLELRALGRWAYSRPQHDYYFFAPRVYGAGNTRLLSGDSYRTKDRVLEGKLEAVAKRRVGWFHNTLLAGVQGQRRENTQVGGAWNYTGMPTVAGSPNVFGSPVLLTGGNVFTYFDPRVHAFPDTRLAQRWADEVKPAGEASRFYSKNLPQAAYAAGSAVAWQGRLAFTAGIRRSRDYTTNSSRDRNGDLTFVAGAPQTGATKRIYTTSWMVGGVLEVRPGLNLYASRNTGESYQSGSLVSRTTFSGAPANIVTAAEQHANPKPNAVGKGYEAGVKLELFDRKLTGTIGWFELTRGGVLITDSARTAIDPRNVATEVDPNPATTNPANRYRVQWSRAIEGNSTAGFEADLVWTPTANYNAVLGASHLYRNRMTVDRPATNDPIVLRDYTVLNGRPLDNTPDNTFRVFNKYTFSQGGLKGFSVGVGYRYQSSQMPTAGDANWYLVFPSYAVVDVNFGYRRTLFQRAVEFQLAIANAANRSYFEGNRVYGAPREFAFITRVRF